MELSFIFYIFAAFIFVPGTYLLLSVFKKSLAGAIAAIGMLIFFILFGIQFYNFDGTYKKVTTVPSWPPSINQCPDFLTLFLMPDGKYVCIDTVGVAPQLSGPNANAIVQFVPTDSSSVPGDNQIFSLSTDMPTVIKQCKDKNVTWEGIYDGVNTYSNTIPAPPSADAASDSASA